MKRLILTLALTLPAFAQPKFEVADVQSSPHSTQPFMRGPFNSSARYEIRYATMLDLIYAAYGLDPEKVYGGPSWLEMDRFDVIAKLPPGSTAESRRKMMQSLLAERFHLATHDDKRPISAYALTAGAKHNLKESDGTSTETGCNFSVQNAPTAPPAPGQSIQLPTIVYTCKNMTMPAFVTALLAAPGAGGYFNNKLVVDQTGLTAAYDFVLKYTPKIPLGIQTTGDAIPIFDAVDKQLGLKLELSTSPQPVMVVDKVDRKPTPNSPDAMKAFPPVPTEFEVASLKPMPANPGGRGGGQQQPTLRNGRLYLPGFSLKNLIMISWDINGDEFLINAPKWLDEDRYEILAKAPADVAIGDLTPQRNGVSVNIDALRPMLKSLVLERFKFVAHEEQRPLNAYNLVAAKPKLKKADPTTRTRWQEGPANDDKSNKNANPSLGRMVTCQNVSMAQLAEMLPGIAPGYLRSDVIDATGLEGGYDFTFSFSPAGLLNQVRPGAPTDEASEPTGAISLFDAMQKQLGLKLELQKRPARVLVIDSIERKPIEN